MNTETEAALRTMLDSLGTGSHHGAAALAHAQSRLSQSSIGLGDRYEAPRAEYKSVMPRPRGDDERKASTLHRFDRETAMGLRWA